jgi:hypothetical protein
MAQVGVHAAREAVRHFYDLDPGEQIATAAIVIAVVTDRGIDIAWAGNSVVFALDVDGVLHTLTKPYHPFHPVPANVTEGVIGTRFVWTTDPRDPMVDQRLNVRRLLVSSDGLTHHLTSARITHILTSADTPQSACQALADAAEDAETDDNLTVAVVDFTPDNIESHGGLASFDDTTAALQLVNVQPAGLLATAG